MGGEPLYVSLTEASLKHHIWVEVSFNVVSRNLLDIDSTHLVSLRVLCSDVFHQEDLRM